MPTTWATSRPSGLRLLDKLIAVIALPLAWEASQHLAPGFTAHPPAATIFLATAFVIPAWTIAAWMNQLYQVSSGAEELLRIVRTAVTLAIACAVLGFATEERQVTRLLVALYCASVFLLATMVRVGWRAAASLMNSGGGARRYAVVGTGGMSREVVEAVDAHPEWGLQFAGFIRTDGSSSARGPFVGSLSELGRTLENEVIDVVIFAVPRERLAEVERAVHLCEEHGVEVRISLDILRFGPGRMMIADMDGVPMLTFTRTPSDAIALGIKRAFDVVMSALVLVGLSPVLLGVAMAIRIDSPGPIFFRQRRVGQNGRAFQMLKFRSMYRDAEARLEALRGCNEMSGPVFKMARDPRVTRVGRFLRKTSLDEFPQFWNVLKGEMSIVGPRPPIPAEVRQYKLWQRRRLSMKPGITCIWQVSGRSNIDFERWMELDLQYIDEWSLLGDIAICFKTIPAVLTTRGAR